MGTERKRLLAAVENYVVALTIVGIVDAISYMLVTPSLVFYVLQNGGTQQQYGLIMSAFSFSSFCTKPLMGWWSDQQGFRVPYIVSILVALLGGGAYVFASALPKGTTAVGCILGARLLSGCGAANSALGYAYVARSVHPSQQTATNSLLSLCRILGMAIGPGMNVLVAKVELPITPDWGLDNLNSVGLLLVLANAISAVVIYCLLDEPEVSQDEVDDEETDTAKDAVAQSAITPVTATPSTPMWEVVRSFCSLDILVPMLCTFTFNANFQVIETGFAPASNDALGWGPIQSSASLGSLSIIIAGNMLCVIKLTKAGVADAYLLCGGILASICAYVSIYRFWIKDSSAWNFYLPIALAAASFPYMMPTTRTIFTTSVRNKPVLREYHGVLQAVLSMAASVAGFTTPGIVTAYFLRTHEEVLASEDQRELKSWTLLAPVLSGMVLLGIGYLMATGIIDTTKEMPLDKGSIAKDDRNAGEGAAATAIAATRESMAVTESSLLLPKGSSVRSSVRSSVLRKRRSSNITIMLEGNFDGGLFEEFQKDSILPDEDTVIYV